MLTVSPTCLIIRPCPYHMSAVWLKTAIMSPSETFHSADFWLRIPNRFVLKVKNRILMLIELEISHVWVKFPWIHVTDSHLTFHKHSGYESQKIVVLISVPRIFLCSKFQNGSTHKFTVFITLTATNSLEFSRQTCKILQSILRLYNLVNATFVGTLE